MYKHLVVHTWEPQKYSTYMLPWSNSWLFTQRSCGRVQMSTKPRLASALKCCIRLHRVSCYLHMWTYHTASCKTVFNHMHLLWDLWQSPPLVLLSIDSLACRPDLPLQCHIRLILFTACMQTKSVTVFPHLFLQWSLWVFLCIYIEMCKKPFFKVSCKGVQGFAVPPCQPPSLSRVSTYLRALTAVNTCKGELMKHGFIDSYPAVIKAQTNLFSTS